MKRKDILSNFKSNLSLIRYFIILCVSYQPFCLSGQLNLDFNNENINAVKWEGNINSFKINTSGQLQLSTSGAGESAIYTRFKIPKDSIQAELYFKLQFAPSNENYGKIYLFTDNIIETSANGYYIRLGENGSNDAIQLWKLKNGTPQLLGGGQMGGISIDPAEARVQFKIYNTGLWVMATDYNGGTIFEEDLEISDSEFSLRDSMYFGIYCKYTATRSDKFFYDDIKINTIVKDTIAPKVLFATVINDQQLKLTLSELPESASAMVTSNFTMDNGLGSPDEAIYSITRPLEVSLIFNNKTIRSGINYNLDIKNLKDRSNNTQPHTVPFVYALRPKKGDLVISEVLTDPFSGGEDFLEVCNISEKFIKLDSLIIRNAQRNEEKVIRSNLLLFPGQYAAISKNTVFLKETYRTPDTARFIESILPAFNVSDANFSLITIENGRKVTIDSFDYTENMHFILIDDTKGVSLERINLQGQTNDKNNWHSASSQSKFGTPGYKNSNSVVLNSVMDESIQLDKKIFTPNGDNIDDFVLLQYKLDKPGYLATIKIFDSEGFPIADLTNNFLLGTEGSIKWDGIDAEGNVVKIGMYIVYAKLLHTDGHVFESKYVVVAAQNY